MDFNYIDIIIIIPLAWGLYKGFTKGIILEVTMLIGLFLGIYCGIHFSNYAASWLSAQFDVDIPILSFAVTFLAVVILVYLLGKVIEKFVDVLALSFFNKILGSVFSAVKHLVIIAIVILIFDQVNKKFSLIPDDIQSSSMFYNPIVENTPKVLPFINDIEMKIDEGIMQPANLEELLNN